MTAQERYEREDRRDAAAGPSGGKVARVRETHETSNVTPFPARPPAPAPSATNVHVAPRPAAPVAAAVHDDPDYAALAVGKANQLLWFVCTVLELLLGLRVLLRLVGANAAAPFVRFIYGVTQPLAAPFLGMLPNLGAAGTPAAPGTGAAVLEVPTLIGMAVYFLLFLLLTYLLRLLISRPARV